VGGLTSTASGSTASTSTVTASGSTAGVAAGRTTNGFWITSGGGASAAIRSTSRAVAAADHPTANHSAATGRQVRNGRQRGLVMDRLERVCLNVGRSPGAPSSPSPSMRGRKFRIRLPAQRLTSKIGSSGCTPARSVGTAGTNGSARGAAGRTIVTVRSAPTPKLWVRTTASAAAPQVGRR
jgi:hypothetical protein